MAHMVLLLRVLWGCSLLLEFAVLLFMTAKKQYKSFPAIYAYVLLCLLQSTVAYLVYAAKGYESWAAYWTGWISQGIVVLARWTAVCELCHKILGQFRGIWGLTWRVLALFGGLALSTALILGRHDKELIISTFDLGLEFAIATVLVVFFLFAKYYDVPVLSSLRSIGIAFCLYSCFRSLNDTVLQKLLRNYSGTWNLVDEITFLATLVLIGSAVYVLQSQPSRKVRLLPSASYTAIVPLANERLSALNERLSQLLKSGTAGRT